MACAIKSFVPTPSVEETMTGSLYSPGFKGIKYLIKTGELPFPLFDSCPAYKTEWAFDVKENIYGCTTSCGNLSYCAGKVNGNDVLINDNLTEEWKTRSILTIEKCKSCSFALFCGGGCGVMSKEHNGGVHKPDCKDIEKIINLGVNYYFEEIKSLLGNQKSCC